jgi:hypothetical protein
MLERVQRRSVFEAVGLTAVARFIFKAVLCGIYVGQNGATNRKVAG